GGGHHRRRRGAGRRRGPAAARPAALACGAPRAAPAPPPLRGGARRHRAVPPPLRQALARPRGGARRDGGAHLRQAAGLALQGPRAAARRPALPRARAPRRASRTAPRLAAEGGCVSPARSQDDFVAARSRDWQELDRLLGASDMLHKLDGAGIARVAALYRSLCTDLMRCRAARYTPDL